MRQGIERGLAVAVQDEVYKALQRLGISYGKTVHEPVRTMEDCAPNAARLGAVMPKNLFLSTRSGKVHVLLVLRADIPLRTADVSRQLGVPRLSFAPPERLSAMLRAQPGAASPMGLLFDRKHAVRLAMDDALWAEPVLAFHPCVPTETLAIRQEDLRAFLAAVCVTPERVILAPQG